MPKIKHLKYQRTNWLFEWADDPGFIMNKLYEVILSIALDGQLNITQDTLTIQTD